MARVLYSDCSSQSACDEIITASGHRAEASLNILRSCRGGKDGAIFYFAVCMQFY